MHLVEDKVTHSDKATTPEQSAETTQSRESSQPPPKALLGTPSRRDGSASLQIAAVVQLQAFLNGEFGKQFQKPAFTLLTSIWLALVRPHCDAMQEDDTPQDAWTGSWRKKWQAISNTPLAQAITRALLDHNSQALRQHSESLPGLLLAGMTTCLPGLDPLELDGFNLQGIQFQGANLHKAQLQGAYLNNAQLQGANLLFAQLQGADLSSAQLQCANLLFAQLHGANLFSAQLQGASLFSAQLQSTKIFNPQFDHHTGWHYAKTDDETLVEIRETFQETTLPLLTHALRLKLRDQCLELPAWRYTEFEAAWNAATQAQRDAALAQAGTQTDYKNDPI
jgi:hypothetical protein